MSGVDELVESMTSGAFISGDNFSSSASIGHPHFTNYKNRGQLAEKQANRRLEFLDQQKSKRSKALFLVRHLEGVEVDDEDEPEEIEADVATERKETADVEKTRRQRRSNRGSPYLNQLMCSEWLVHVPENFTEEWIMVPCPEGKRALVVAANGTTRAYAKNGYQLKEFPSSLPGDFRGPGKQSSSNPTVLDCVFCEGSKTFYCLDVICWNGCPVFDSDTEFRFFWLQSKMSETPSLAEASKSNRYTFKFLQRCAGEVPQMETIMREKFPYKLDGVLFYHKRAHYVAGQTPLVGWLKPFMLPEIVGVAVPEEFTLGKEETRSTDFMADFDADYGKKHSGRQYGGKMKAETQAGDVDMNIADDAKDEHNLEPMAK